MEVESTPLYVRNAPAGEPLSAARREEKDLSIICHVNITNSGAESPGEIRVTAGGGSYRFPVAEVRFGFGRYEIALPEWSGTLPVKVEASIGRRKLTRSAQLASWPKYKFLVAESTHLDIGFTDPEPVCAEKHTGAFDEALEFIEKGEGPDYHYSCEGTWALEQFANSRSAERMARVVELAKEGRIEIGALHSSIGTWGPGHEEITRVLYPAKRFKDRYGIPVTGAMHVDIPGLGWGMPQVLAGAGVKYLACGVNEGFNAESFERELPTAFWWEGPEGSRVLTWIAEGYGEPRMMGLASSKTEGFYYKMWRRLERMRARGYAGDGVMLFGGYFDNGGLSPSVSQCARVWNGKYAYPKVVLCTVSEGLGYVEQNAGSQLPVLRGDWAGYWDGVIIGGASRHNWTREHLPVAEKLWSLNSLLNPANGYPREELAAANEALIHHWVHGGGTLGTRAEQEEALRWVQQYEVAAFVPTRTWLSRGLQRFTHLFPWRPFTPETYLVFNPSSWARTGVTELEIKRRFPGPMAMKDLATGEVSAIATSDIVSYEWGRQAPASEVRFVAREVPALGYKLYELVEWDPKQETSLRVTDKTIENEFYRVTVDAAEARVTSVYDKRRGRELVDTASPYGFNDLIISRAGLWLEWGGGPDDRERYHSAGTKARVERRGPAEGAIVVERPGAACFRSEVVLHAGLDSVEVRNSVDYKQVPQQEREEAQAYVQVFPLRLAEPELKVQTATTFFTPGKDQLPGAGERATYVAQHGGEIHNRREGITWATAENNAFRFGWLRAPELRSGRLPEGIPLLSTFATTWAEPGSSGVDPYYTTQTFRYAFRSHAGGFDAAAAARFGEGLNQPLLAQRMLRAEGMENAKSFLSVSGSGVSLLAFKQCESGRGYALRLLNWSDRGGPVTLASPLFRGVKAWRATSFEEPVSPLAVEGEEMRLELGAHGLATVVFER
jgi:hypothetical protein